MSSLCSHVETVLRLSLKALDVRPGAIIGDWLAPPIHDVLAEQAIEPFCTFAGGISYIPTPTFTCQLFC